MRITIIPADSAVYVNGAAVSGLAIGAPEGVRALQWKGNSGWIEYDDGQLNEQIGTLPPWAVDAIAVREQRIADELAIASAPPTAEQLAAQAAEAKLQADASEAMADEKLSAITDMSPDEVRDWIGKHVGTRAYAKDILATLAVAVSVLTRKL